MLIATSIVCQRRTVFPVRKSIAQRKNRISLYHCDRAALAAQVNGLRMGSQCINTTFMRFAFD